MHRITFLFYTFFFTLTSIAQDSSAVQTQGRLFTQALTNTNYEQAISLFSTDMKPAITPEQLEKIWLQVQQKTGPFDHSGPAYVQAEDNGFTYRQPYHFKHVVLDLKLAFDSSDKIIGFFFLPHEVIQLDLVNNTQITEEAITISAEKKIQLPGILTLPKSGDNFPVVILVHGSGPNDMNSSIGPNAPFKDLAHGLAKQGVAVIRYDKRTKTYGGNPILDPAQLTLEEETIDDALAAVKLASKDRRLDAKNIFVLGYSLGAMSAPQIARKGKRIKGIIIVAGNARPLQKVVLDQYRYLTGLDSVITTEEQQLINQYTQQMKNLEKLPVKKGTAHPPLPFNLSATYWQYLLDYDQVATAAKLHLPILIMQGERDYQVTVKEFELWKAALKDKTNVTFKLYPLLNHILLEGEGPSGPAEYEEAGQVPQYFISDIVNWIKQ